MITKTDIIDICEKNKTIPTEKLKMDSTIGRVPTQKTQEWIDTYFERSKFELLDYEKSKSDLIQYVIENSNEYILDFKVNDSICDIFVPEYKVGFKMISLLYHGEIYVNKSNQLQTWTDFNNSDYRIIQVFEDSWNIKNDIVKSRIKNILNRSEKIYARKCIIKEILDTQVISDFVKKTHIQGTIGSSVKLGLYYNDELVSLMTFGKLRTNLGQKNKEGSFELLRFVNKEGTNVVGGASKLFNHFINNWNPITIISYADKCWSNHNCLYSKLGMTHVHESDPSYFYIVGTKRKGRYGYRKDVNLLAGYDGSIWGEHSIMLDKNCFRIFDVGTTKYVCNKENNL